LNITLHVSDGLSFPHQDVIQVSWKHASEHEMGLQFHLASTSTQSTNLYDIYLTLYVQSWTPDYGRKDRPKHVEWYSINSKNCASSWFYHRNLDLCMYFGKNNAREWVISSQPLCASLNTGSSVSSWTISINMTHYNGDSGDTFSHWPIIKESL